MPSTSFVLDQAEPQFHEEICVEIQCHKDSNVVHRVRPMLLTIDNLKRMWEVGRKYRTIFGHEHLDDFWKFVSFFVTLEDGEPARSNGLFWIIDDFAGMFYLRDIVPAVDASVHFAFYKSMGVCKTPLIKAALSYCFNKYQFHRISTEAPLFSAKYTFQQIEALGFVWEGKKRSARFYDNKYFHVNYYGLLRDDFERMNDG